MSIEDRDREGPGCEGYAAPYVLGALTDAEHESFVRHLDTCAVCREEVVALATVTAALPALAPQLEPPPELKRRVMSEVRDDVRLQASGAEGASRPSLPSWMRLRVLSPVAVGLAAVALAAVVLAGGGTAKPKLIRAQVTIPGASAFVRVSGGHAQLDVSGMPATSGGRVYEVWLKRNGSPEPTNALFHVSAGGRASVGVPGSVQGVKLMLVTDEPAGGSAVPTSTPSVIARLG